MIAYSTYLLSLVIVKKWNQKIFVKYKLAVWIKNNLYSKSSLIDIYED